MEAEASEARARYGSLSKQYDEAVHKANLARAARERAAAEAARKEEELCALEVGQWGAVHSTGASQAPQKQATHARGLPARESAPLDLTRRRAARPSSSP